jgi:predicted ATPase
MPELIRHIAPKNFLSFGPDNPGIELRALNVLIGPNGSGKSNLIEAINFMRAAPKEFGEVTRKGGGVDEWIWKGGPGASASVEWVVRGITEGQNIHHSVTLGSHEHAFQLADERMWSEAGEHYSLQDDFAFDPDRSILVERRNPKDYPELASLARNYEKIRIYGEWTFGRDAVFRVPQKADMRSEVLEEDFSNLGLFLNRIKTRFPVAKKAILARLADLYEGIDDLQVDMLGGAVQVFLTEGNYGIPASRLSDGTLRYLCLLAILCDPEPPPLICIEEPELGLHPDILPKVAELLREASERTQLIVTTHSDILVDAMTETPEAVVVCSKQEGQTRMERLKAEDLAVWLDKYRLGSLWISGQIGGTRW